MPNYVHRQLELPCTSFLIISSKYLVYYPLTITKCISLLHAAHIRFSLLGASFVFLNLNIKTLNVFCMIVSLMWH